MHVIGVTLLVLSETQGFRHDSIPAGVAAVRAIGEARSWVVTTTEDSSVLAGDLGGYSAIVFLNTTGDVLDDAEQAGLQAFVRAGGGWAGVHSASDTEHGWPWYGELVGARFAGHPAPQNATVRVLDRDHPATRALPPLWGRFDEWYDFAANPRGTVHVLATLDERTYSGGQMGADHPIAWCRELEGGRSFYTAGGHTAESFGDPVFLAHLAGGLEFAAGVAGGDCGATLEGRFEKVVLETDVHEPMELAVAPDGRVFFIERRGRVRVYDPVLGITHDGALLDVAANQEDGLLGLALDPQFATTQLVYLYYSPAGPTPVQRLSRFRMDGDLLDLASEEILLTVDTQRDECCHSGGSLAFDPMSGDLYVATGDNTNPFASDGFTPIDERPGRSSWDAQRSSGNTQDLRGKILRVRPGPVGLSIPAGNLFPGGIGGRPEIYVMGARNPFRISVDGETGALYFGDVGPDAGAAGARGPTGFDELNRVTAAGHFGWPWCIADNRPYGDHDFASGVTGAAFDCGAPVNDSPNNTGAGTLPAAMPAWVYYPYGASSSFPQLGEGGRTVMAGPVYHHDPALASPTKLPAYYQRTLFAYEWSRNWIKEIKLADDGTILGILPFLPSVPFIRPMDIEVGPDGSLYILEYGTGWGDNDDAQLVRVDYAGGRFTPVAALAASPTSGPLPLEVVFSAAGSTDPNGDALSYQWDFDGDGTVDASGLEVRHTYEQAGTFRARLSVIDPGGHAGAASATVTAGNSAPRVVFELPAAGGLYGPGEWIHYRVRVEDAEDGTTDDCISCQDVTVQPAVGHDDHAHPLVEQNGCEGVVRIDLAEDPELENLSFVLTARYTDRGAPGSEPLMASATVQLQPRRRQAEFFSASEGVEVETTTDVAGGGRNLGFITHGDWVSYAGVDLAGIEAVRVRAASAGFGGRIEVHAGGREGPLLASLEVPVTGDWQVYQDVMAPISDPGGAHDLFLVFLGQPGQDGLFNVNWIDFVGQGISTVEAPVVPERPPFTGNCSDPSPDGGTTSMGSDGACGCRADGRGGGLAVLLLAILLGAARLLPLDRRRRLR